MRFTVDALLDACTTFKRYVSGDARPLAFLASVLLALQLLLSAVLPTRRDVSGRNITPIEVRFLAIVVSAAAGLVILGILVRAAAWIKGSPLNAAQTARRIGSYLWPSVLTFICMGLIYVPIVLIAYSILLAAGLNSTRDLTLISGLLSPVLAALAFAGTYALPALVLDDRIGFRNVSTALKASLSHPVLTLCLIAPGVLWSLSQMFLPRSGINIATKMIGWLIGVLITLMSLFLYTGFGDKSGKNAGAA